jgi:hypothetical protein
MCLRTIAGFPALDQTGNSAGGPHLPTQTFIALHRVKKEVVRISTRVFTRHDGLRLQPLEMS